jgi:benzodiazapine receptor
MDFNNSRFLKFSNIASLAATILVNSIAGATNLIGGQNTAQVSDSNPTLITPAGYVFSIWGIIYLLLGVFVIVQTLPSQKTKTYHQKIGPLFILTNVLNIVWIFLWQFEFLMASVLVMFMLLASLMAIYLRLNIGKAQTPLFEKLGVQVPFSVYLGWITIAAIANVSVTLVSLHWDGFGISPQNWASLILAVALFIALLVLATRKDVAYALVIVWALVGISVKQSANQAIVSLTQLFAVAVAVAIVVVVLWVKFRKKAARTL